MKKHIKNLILQHGERSELKRGKLTMFCLQNEASFGKSQLLNGSNLANQNKNKMAQKLLYFQNKGFALVEKRDFLSDFKTFSTSIVI